MKYSFIAIEGNIGSGKTTFAKKLAKDFNGNLILENFADNPFLPKFYHDPVQYAFPLELFFMAERFQQMKNIVRGNLFNDFTVSDYLFTKSLLFANTTLAEDEKLLFRKLFNIMQPLVPQPQLIVYLHNSVNNLLVNISRRGRPFEQGIEAAYLENIQLSYFRFFKSSQHNILVIDTSNLDFVEKTADYEKIVALIRKDYGPGTHFINP